jgi:hypothetical protein
MSDSGAWPYTEIRDLKAEIERLKVAHDHQYAIAGTLLREAECVNRENEQLRDLLKECGEYAISLELWNRIVEKLGL